MKNYLLKVVTLSLVLGYASNAYADNCRAERGFGDSFDFECNNSFGLSRSVAPSALKNLDEMAESAGQPLRRMQARKDKEREYALRKYQAETERQMVDIQLERMRLQLEREKLELSKSRKENQDSNESQATLPISDSTNRASALPQTAISTDYKECIEEPVWYSRDKRVAFCKKILNVE